MAELRKETKQSFLEVFVCRCFVGRCGPYNVARGKWQEASEAQRKHWHCFLPLKKGQKSKASKVAYFHFLFLLKLKSSVFLDMQESRFNITYRKPTSKNNPNPNQNPPSPTFQTTLSSQKKQYLKGSGSLVSKPIPLPTSNECPNTPKVFIRVLMFCPIKSAHRLHLVSQRTEITSVALDPFGSGSEVATAGRAARRWRSVDR